MPLRYGCSVLGALPVHELLPEEGVLVVLVHVVALEDLSKVIASGTVLLGGLIDDGVTGLHLGDELLERHGVLLGEVRLFLTTLLGVPVSGETSGLAGSEHHAGLRESSLEGKHLVDLFFIYD